MSNHIGNRQLTHEDFGFSSTNRGQGQVKFGKKGKNGKDQDNQIPGDMMLRNALQSSPYAFRSLGPVTMDAANAAKDWLYPCVLFDDNDFGQGAYNAKLHTRDNKPWRMYAQDAADESINLFESLDGLSWDFVQQLDPALFPASPNHVLEGLQVFYDSTGLLEVSAVSYNYAAIARDAAKTTADATDLWLYYSLDGITWLRTAMANHDSSGNPFVEVASSLGLGAAYIEKADPNAGTFAATLPKTFRNAPGNYWSIQKYADVPAQLGDTVPGEAVMAVNSTDAADVAELGHFANWNRKLLRQVGEHSYGQCTNAYIHHVCKYKDYYVALVQLWFQVAGAATRIRSGIATAISRDGLIFDYVGPLFDAGLVAAYNERTSAVDQTNMATTAAQANAGDGTGVSITAGSIVLDKKGRCFGGLGGRTQACAHLARVYWTEQDSGKVLVGHF